MSKEEERICIGCDEKTDPNTDMITPDGRSVCESCYHDDTLEPEATVFFNNDKTPNTIGSYHNETEENFTVKWVGQGYRGYYECESKTYTNINTAEVLSMHESEQMLKDFNDKIMEEFDEHEVEFARVFCRSSNVFYTSFELWVKKGHEIIATLLMNKIKSEIGYDDDKWYKNIIFDETALEGLKKLFPEKKISTDSDAAKLVEEFGDKMIPELEARMKA
jgi:hypothetical protein